MNYKTIQKAYEDLYSYTHTKLPFVLSTHGQKIISELENFFLMTHTRSQKVIENDAKNEGMYFGVLYEYLQDLQEDLEDLDDEEFEIHKEEYRTVNSLLNSIIAMLAHDPE